MYKKISLSLAALSCAVSLQAFGLGDAASALSAVQSTTQTTKAAPATTKDQSSGLMGMLTSQLGVTDKQAAGGVGSILNYAKGELPSNDYSTLAGAIPNSSSLLAMAPQASSSLGALGAMGGSSAGGMAALASQFSSLGLSSSMITQFVPVILNYFKGTNATGAAGILSGLF